MHDYEGDLKDPEIRPDAWERFERAVDHAVKTPAMNQKPSGPKK